jgi:hypothetical protein
MDSKESGREPAPKNGGSMVGLGISMGAGVGIAFGAALHRVGVGLVFGAGFGVIFGALLDKIRRKSG